MYITQISFYQTLPYKSQRFVSVEIFAHRRSVITVFCGCALSSQVIIEECTTHVSQTHSSLKYFQRGERAYLNRIGDLIILGDHALMCSIW
jgi:hypothetical protein